jgi:hypothetical protein
MLFVITDADYARKLLDAAQNVYDFAAKYQGIYTNSFPAVTFNYR